MFKIFNVAYPERMATAYVVGADWLFSILWAIVKPFVSKDTLKKIMLLKKPEDLQNYIAKEKLLDLYGGDFKFSFQNKESISKEKEKEED